MAELTAANKIQNQLKSFKQLSMFEPIPMAFGGSLLRGKRKSKRTLTTKKAMHLIMKGDVSFSGPLMLKSKWIVEETKRLAKKFCIQIYGELGIEVDHMHMIIKISSVENYKKFIKALTGRMAQVLKFKFIYRPFTKIVEWGRQFKWVINYCLQNKEEAFGIRTYKPRHKRKIIKNSRKQGQQRLGCEVFRSNG